MRAKYPEKDVAVLSCHPYRTKGREDKFGLWRCGQIKMSVQRKLRAALDQDADAILEAACRSVHGKDTQEFSTKQQQDILRLIGDFVNPDASRHDARKAIACCASTVKVRTVPMEVRGEALAVLRALGRKDDMGPDVFAVLCNLAGDYQVPLALRRKSLAGVESLLRHERRMPERMVKAALEASRNFLDAGVCTGADERAVVTFMDRIRVNCWHLEHNAVAQVFEQAASMIRARDLEDERARERLTVLALTHYTHEQRHTHRDLCGHLAAGELTDGERITLIKAFGHGCTDPERDRYVPAVRAIPRAFALAAGTLQIKNRQRAMGAALGLVGELTSPEHIDEFIEHKFRQVRDIVRATKAQLLHLEQAFGTVAGNTELPEMARRACLCAADYLGSRSKLERQQALLVRDRENGC